MVRVGIAGIGFMGMTHFKAYKEIEDAEVIAICTRNPKKLAGDWRAIKGNFGDSGGIQDLSAIKRYTELGNLIDDPDVDLIDICLPTPLHCQVAIQAFRAGKDVIVEKPIGMDVQEADMALEMAKKTGRLFMVAQVLRFFPEFALLKQVVDDRRLGSLLALHLHRMIASDWHRNPNRKGSMVSELHIHDADFAVHLLGTPETLYATGTIGANGNVSYLCAQYGYPGMCVSIITGSLAMPSQRFAHGYSAYFEEGTLTFDSTSGKGVELRTIDGKVSQPELPFADAFVAELRHAVACVSDPKTPCLLSAESARNSLWLCEKTVESIRSGSILKLK